MQNKHKTQDPKMYQVYLSGAAINSLVKTMASGTGYYIAIVLIVMMTGRLIKEKGSLARAVLPFVVEAKWGWHRVERAMERGKYSLDEMIEKAYQWCIKNMEVESVKIGSKEREVMALDSSTIARQRSQERKGSGLGKGYSHKVGRAIRANIVAALVSVVRIKGIRVGLLRGLRYGKSSEQAVENMFKVVNKISQNCLIIVDAGIATKEQFACATKEQALLGRLRINCKLRTAPPAANGKRGRNNIHGPVLHPGKGRPEVKADQDFKISITRDKKKESKRFKKIENIKNFEKTETVEIRIRRWNNLHFEGYETTKLDVLRIDDPAYKNPLLIATTAQGELSSEQFIQSYPHRWPVETLFFIGEQTTATEKPRAWTQLSVERRIGLGLLAASLLKAISAIGNGLASGPWDLNPKPSAGRLANHLDIHLPYFLHIALNGLFPRIYNKFSSSSISNTLPLKDVA